MRFRPLRFSVRQKKKVGRSQGTVDRELAALVLPCRALPKKQSTEATRCCTTGPQKNPAGSRGRCAGTEASRHESRRSDSRRGDTAVPENHRLPWCFAISKAEHAMTKLQRSGCDAQQAERMALNEYESVAGRGLIQRGVTLSASGAYATLLAARVVRNVPPMLAISTMRAAATIRCRNTLTACGISSTVVALTQGCVLKNDGLAETTVTIDGLMPCHVASALRSWGILVRSGTLRPGRGQAPSEPPKQPVEAGTCENRMSRSHARGTSAIHCRGGAGATRNDPAPARRASHCSCLFT